MLYVDDRGCRYTVRECVELGLPGVWNVYCQARPAGEWRMMETTRWQRTAVDAKMYLSQLAREWGLVRAAV